MTATKRRKRKRVMDAEFFSVRLKQLRQKAGLNQGQLAQRAGLKANTISQLESGARWPSWETIIRLADALGVTCEEFRKDPASHPMPSVPDAPEPPAAGPVRKPRRKE